MASAIWPRSSGRTVCASGVASAMRNAYASRTLDRARRESPASRFSQRSFGLTGLAGRLGLAAIHVGPLSDRAQHVELHLVGKLATTRLGAEDACGVRDEDTRQGPHLLVQLVALVDQSQHVRFGIGRVGCGR